MENTIKFQAYRLRTKHFLTEILAPMNVPLLDLTRQYTTIANEIEPKVLELIRSQKLILGKPVEELEQTIADYCDSKYAIGVSSGTDAQLMALMALNIGPGDEVIVPTFSFFATAGVVVRLGATPVFVDVDPITYNMDADAMKKRITNKTKAIMPVHLFGQAFDIDAIEAIANKFGIPIIEDAAQAIGTQYPDGTKVGCRGLMGTFSFYPTKNLGAFGDGGVITTNDEKLAIHLKQMRNHGMEPKYYHSFIGGNFRLDALQAEVLNVKFPHLESWHQKRRENAELYNSLFINAGVTSAEFPQTLTDENRIVLPKAVNKNSGVPNHHIYNQYTIRVQNRDEVRANLTTNGIGTEIYYPLNFHDQECFAYLGEKTASFPVANEAAKTCLALPIFPELTTQEIEYVAQTVINAIKK